MEEKENSEGSSNGKKQIRQPPSIPFLWEEKPGKPKKDWKPDSHPASPSRAIPVKLVASVPFTWEEKPGNPLPSFSDQHPNSSQFDLDSETFVSSSDHSPLANGLQSTMKLSTAVPVLETPLSPDSETGSSDCSSSQTGGINLRGSSFLECLFPLFSPDSGFLEKVGCNSEKDQSLTPWKLQRKDFDWENDCGVRRRAPTLGELMMMSRRISCRRKAVQLRKGHLMKVYIFGSIIHSFICCGKVLLMYTFSVRSFILLFIHSFLCCGKGMERLFCYLCEKVLFRRCEEEEKFREMLKANIIVY